jgi:hypothetical protein
LKAFLEHFAAIVGAVTVAILAISVSHEYGYFWSIGPQFQTFLTTTDYLANGVLWIPFGVIFLLQAGEWKLEAKPTLRYSGWALWLWVTIMGGSLVYVVLTVTWPLDFIFAFSIFGISSVIWAFMWEKVCAKVSLDEPFQRAAQEVVKFGPPILLGMFVWGSVNAREDLTTTRRSYDFRFKNEEIERPMIFLRNFDKGILLRNPVENKIEFRKWEDIATISKSVPDPTRPLSCVFFSRWCPSPPTKP